MSVQQTQCDTSSCHLRALKTTGRLTACEEATQHQRRKEKTMQQRQDFILKNAAQQADLGFEASGVYTASSEQPGLLHRRTLSQGTSKQKCGANENLDSRR